MHYVPSGDVSTLSRFSVYPIAAFRVSKGVNQGDPLTNPRELCLGDAYTLAPQAPKTTLLLEELAPDPVAPGPVFTVSAECSAAEPGSLARPTALLKFMTATGMNMSALFFECRDAQGPCQYLSPTDQIEPGTDYILIDVQEPPSNLPGQRQRSMSFTRGTRITLSSGQQKPVNELAPGDLVLTRDHGMQPIHWIGTEIVQGIADFAPVVISPGTFGNPESLIISQQHRLLISDWRAEVMVGSREVLISAGDLINDDTIFLRPGGFVEYTQIVLDAHHVIYAEGVATESLALSQRMLLDYADETAQEILAALPGLPLHDAKYSHIPLSRDVARNLIKQIRHV